MYLFSSSDQICTAFYVMLPSPWTCTLSIIHIISRKGVTEKKPICFNKYFENWPQDNFFHGFMGSPKFFTNRTYFVVLWLVNFFSGVLIVSFIHMKDGRIITKIALYKSYQAAKFNCKQTQNLMHLIYFIGWMIIRIQKIL